MKLSPKLSPRLCLSLLACVGATACGSIPTKTFTFDAIDVSERPRPCLIVIDDDWASAADKNHVVNVTGDDKLELTLEFRSAEIEVTVAPLTVDGDVVSTMPRSRKEARDVSGFMDETRRLKVTDPATQFFILPYKSGG